jgi:hypothetical protein
MKVALVAAREVSPSPSDKSVWDIAEWRVAETGMSREIGVLEHWSDEI